MSDPTAKTTPIVSKSSGGEPSVASTPSAGLSAVEEKSSNGPSSRAEEAVKSVVREELQGDHALRSSDPPFVRSRQASPPRVPATKASTSEVKLPKAEPPTAAKGAANPKNAKSAKATASSNPQATNLRRWFRQLSIEERRRVVSIMDEEMTELVLLMSLKLKNEGPGFFYEVGNTDEVDLFAPTEVSRNRSNSLSHLPPYSPSAANTNNRQGRSLFRNAPSSSSSRRSATSAGVSAPGSGASSRSLSQTRESIVRFRQPMRGVTSASSGNNSSSGTATRARAASKGATPSSGPASLTSSTSSSSAAGGGSSKMTTSHSASSLSPSSSATHVSTPSLSTPKRTSSSSVADVLHRLGDECNSMPSVADAIHRLGDQFAKKASAPSLSTPSSSSAPSLPSSSTKSKSSSTSGGGSSISSPSSSSASAPTHVRANSASPSVSVTTAGLSSSSSNNVRSKGAGSRAPFPVRYFDDFFASDLIALNPYTPNEENFLFRPHCSLINTDSFTSATMRLEEELMDAVRLGDAKRYLDTITLSIEILRNPSHFFNVMRVASRGAFLKKPCAMSWQAKDKSWVVSPPEWFEGMGFYTFSTFVASQVEMRLWQGYYHYANIDPRRETGHFGSGSSKASAKVPSNRHQDTLVSKSHLVDFWTKLSLAQKTDLIRSMGNMIEAKVKLDFTELSYPQLLHYMLKLTSITHNVSNADNPLLQPNNEREFIDFIFLSPLRRAGTGVDLVLRRLGVFIETAYVDQQRADLILGEKMEKEKALSKGRHNKRKSKTVHSHTMPSSSDLYSTKHNLSGASSSGVQITDVESVKSAPVSPSKAVPSSSGTPTVPPSSSTPASISTATESHLSMVNTPGVSLPSPNELSGLPKASGDPSSGPLSSIATAAAKLPSKPEPIESTMSIQELTAAGFTIAGRRKTAFTRAKDDSAAPNQKKQPHADQVKAQAHRRSKDDTHSGTWTGPPKKSSPSSTPAPSTTHNSIPGSTPKVAPGSPKSKRSAEQSKANSNQPSSSVPHPSSSTASASNTASNNASAAQSSTTSPSTAPKKTDRTDASPEGLGLSPSSSSSSITNVSAASAHTAPSKLMQSGGSTKVVAAHPPPLEASAVPAHIPPSSSPLRLSSDSLPAPTQFAVPYDVPLSASMATSPPGAQARPLGMSDPSYASSTHIHQHQVPHQHSQHHQTPGTSPSSHFHSAASDHLDDLDYPPGMDHLSMGGTTESSVFVESAASGSEAQRSSLRSSGSSASSESMSISSAPPVSTVHFHQNQVYYTSSVRGKMHSHHSSNAHRHRDDSHAHAHQRASSKPEHIDHHHHGHGDSHHHETMSDKPHSRPSRQQQQLDSLEDRPHPTHKTRTMPSLFRSGPAPSGHVGSYSSSGSSSHHHNHHLHQNQHGSSNGSSNNQTSSPVDTPSSIKSSLNANASPYYPASPSTFSPPRSAQMHSSSMRQSTPPGRLQGTESWLQKYSSSNPSESSVPHPNQGQSSQQPHLNANSQHSHGNANSAATGQHHSSQRAQPAYNPQWMQYPIEFGPKSSADTRQRSVDDISTTPTAHARNNQDARHHHHGHHHHTQYHQQERPHQGKSSKSNKRSGNHHGSSNHGSSNGKNGDNHHAHAHPSHDESNHGNLGNHNSSKHANGLMGGAQLIPLMPEGLAHHPLAYTGVVHAVSGSAQAAQPQGGVIFALPHHPGAPLPAGAVMAPYIVAATMPPPVPEEFRVELPNRSSGACKRLQKDIEDFVARVDSITGPRTVTVLKVVGKVQAAVDACFPGQGLVAEIYGSFSTRLGIPASDLDLVITCPRPSSKPSSANNSPISTPTQARQPNASSDLSRTMTTSVGSPQASLTINASALAVPESSTHMEPLSPREILVDQLTSLYSALTRETWVKPEKMQLIDTATVPVIKLTCQDSELPVDITMEDRAKPHTGLLTRALTQQFCKEWPELRPLVLVLKQMVHLCNLHHIYTGGISSYFLTILVVSYLQLYGHTAETVAGHLLNLLDLYGNRFSFQATRISILAPGSHKLLPASHFAHPPPNADGSPHPGPTSFAALNIVDPLNPTQTVGQSVFGMPHVQMAFHNAFTKLHLHYIADGGSHAATTHMKLEELLTGISPLQPPT